MRCNYIIHIHLNYFNAIVYLCLILCNVVVNSFNLYCYLLLFLLLLFYIPLIII